MEDILYHIRTILGSRFFDFESFEDENCQMITFCSRPKQAGEDPDWEMYVGTDGTAAITCFSYRYDSSVGAYTEKEVVGFSWPYEDSNYIWNRLFIEFQTYLKENDEAQAKEIADEQLAQLFDRLDKYGE